VEFGFRTIAQPPAWPMYSNPIAAPPRLATAILQNGLVNAFKRCGITYRHSDRDRSAIYSDALPLFTAGRVKLLDNKRLVMQLASLERRTSSLGKDRVDHGPGGHDDAANVAAGAMVLASSEKLEEVPIIAPIIVGRARTISGGTVSTEAA
jgi:hypothetical protein